MFTGLHSDLFLGSGEQSSTNPYDSNEELHQGMLSSVTDDIINLIMSMDVVHFKTMLDKSRATSQDQEEELRRRQTTISDFESKVSQGKMVLFPFKFCEIKLKFIFFYFV